MPRYSRSSWSRDWNVGVVERLDDPALGEQVVAVGDGGGEVHVLLDEQDGDALGLDLPRMISPICCDDAPGRGPRWARRSSSSRAPIRSTRAMASICCSPPDSLVPGKSPALVQHRELPRRPAPASTRPCSTTGGSGEVLRDGQAGVDAAVVGHPAEAGRARWCAETSGRVALPSSRIVPSTWRCRPMTQRSSVVLPAPLRPTRVTTSPGLDRAARRRAAPAPRRTRRTAGSMRRCAVLPSMADAALRLPR